MALRLFGRTSLVDIPDVLTNVMTHLHASAVARFGQASTSAQHAAKPMLRDIDWLVFSIGGGLSAVDCFSVRRGTWSAAAALPIPRRLEVTELDGYMYAFGGAESSVGQEDLRVARYNQLEDSWEVLGKLPSVARDAWGCDQLQARQAVQLDGAIYVSGERHIARFDPPNRWQILPAMPGDMYQLHDILLGEAEPTSRRGFKMVVVGGLLYAVGGEARSQRGSLFSDKVDCYDPRTNAWTECASLPSDAACSAASLGQVVALGQKIVVVDSSEELYLSSASRAWCLDTVGDCEWRELPANKLARRQAFSVVLDDSLFVLGGFARNYDELSAVQRLCASRDGAVEWDTFAAMRAVLGSGAALAVPELHRIYVMGDRVPADSPSAFMSPFEVFQSSAWKPSPVTATGWDDVLTGGLLMGGEWQSLPCVPTPRQTSKLVMLRAFRRYLTRP
eukprot:TRINITY_DN39952_c0_g1_i1.p1 TRINITY_DN39952_c0_g1~~TRINITY_DN39952_c0_g1_i1.p1  ORF type:complete len:448 (-),score=49.15 TRINITY_DN39952_c0_g1_i1:177-1520(-)